MKRIITVALLFIATPVYASIDSNLRYGSTGPQVVELQEFLIDQGFLNSQPTGNFYSLTRKAVKDYQKSKGIAPTGFVGPITRKEINNELDTSKDDVVSGIIDVSEIVEVKPESTSTLQKPLLQYIVPVTPSVQPVVQQIQQNKMKQLTVTKTLGEVYEYSDGGKSQEILFVASYTEDGKKPRTWKVEFSSPELPRFDGAGIHNCEREEACTDSKGVTIKESGTYNFIFSVTAEDGTVTTQSLSETITL